MNILVTGNRGYIGSVLTPILEEEGYSTGGYDTFYYEGLSSPNAVLSSGQINKDIRLVNEKDIEGFEALIHLAALSNDPLGEFNPDLTEQINLQSTLKLARLAKSQGIRRFVFVSSQSMYGVSEEDHELDEDNSKKNPVTTYAKTKWEAECQLRELQSDDFTIVIFRPSTVFGSSPMLRCDIVYNNLLACAYTTGKIEIKSDGSPWRPVIHIRDVCRAIIAGLEAPAELVGGKAFNVGIKNGNYTVREIAEAAQRLVPGSKLIFTGEHNSDSRTYRVSFEKILTVLKDYFKPEWDLMSGGDELIRFFKQVGFTEDMFRGRFCNRLVQLKHLISQKRLDQHLFWKNSI